MNKIYIGTRKYVESETGQSQSDKDNRMAIYYKAEGAMDYAQIDFVVLHNKKSKIRIQENNFHIVSNLSQNVGLPDSSQITEIKKEDCPKACFPVFNMLDFYWASR